MVKIAHLYYDLLNLYGESGNILALESALDNLEIEYEVDKLTIGSEIDFLSYDLIYMGSGTEKNIEIVNEDIKKYVDDIKKYIDQNKIMLITGNALDLFGKYICLNDETKIHTLDIFNFYSKEQEKRVVGEVKFKMQGVDNLIGFTNHSCNICEEVIKNYSSLFEISKTIGFKNNSKEEGITRKNFYGTYIIGPILARNPEILLNIVTRIIENCNIDIKYNVAIDSDFESSAKAEFIKNYYEKKKK